MNKGRNPRWAWDELVLALDLYFREPQAYVLKNHPEVLRLSNTLRRLQLYPDYASKANFRNANSVSMKLWNFRRLDEATTKNSLSHGSKEEEKVWRQFHDNRVLLGNIVEGIYSFTDGTTIILEEVANTEDNMSFAFEGRILMQQHLTRERSSALVRKKKQTTLDKTGKLVCEACDFDFVKYYGPIGEGFIECHHCKPVSQLRPSDKTKLSDLVLVCSNCHRMLHRNESITTVKELKDAILQNLNWN